MAELLELPKSPKIPGDIRGASDAKNEVFLRVARKPPPLLEDEAGTNVLLGHECFVELLLDQAVYIVEISAAFTN